jgi:hypothetical protein
MFRIARFSGLISEIEEDYYPDYYSDPSDSLGEEVCGLPEEASLFCEAGFESSSS